MNTSYPMFHYVCALVLAISLLAVYPARAQSINNVGPIWERKIEDVIANEKLTEEALEFKPSTKSQVKWQLKFFIAKTKKDIVLLRETQRAFAELVEMQKEKIKVNAITVDLLKAEILQREIKFDRLTKKAGELNEILRNATPPLP